MALKSVSHANYWNAKGVIYNWFNWIGSIYHLNKPLNVGVFTTCCDSYLTEIFVHRQEGVRYNERGKGGL